MRSFLRVAAVLLASLSLLLLLAVGIACAHSFWRNDGVSYYRTVANGDMRAWGVESIDGAIWLESTYWGADDAMRQRPPRSGWRTHSYVDYYGPVGHLTRDMTASVRSIAGFGFASVEFQGYESRRILVPHWALLIVLSVAPAILVKRFAVSRRRRGLGVCSHCGYDLRATPGRCPECGTPSTRVNAVP